MFHVNVWSLPYVACMVGAKPVLPGPALDGPCLHELIEGEGVTPSAGVPTVWQGLLAHVKAAELFFSTMRRTLVGGSSCLPAMTRAFQDDYEVLVLHAWGMTEMSPRGTVGSLMAKHQALSPEARQAVQSKHGRAIYRVDMKIVGEGGAELPWDGVSAGEPLVRGPWIAARYFQEQGAGPLAAGWFPTCDVATTDADGYMEITDRAKDVIKSGGEWIGSIELENIAMSHPSVQMAACIAARHPKWDERPLIVAVRKSGTELCGEELIRHFEGKVARWWIPDAGVFVQSIPLGPTGKMQKSRLREQFGEHLLS